MAREPGALPKMAPPPLNASVRQDLKRLERVSPPPGTPVSPLATLTTMQLYEIERMAAQGMNLAQIGIRLRFPEDIWTQYMHLNPHVKEAFDAGAARGIDLASASLLRGAEQGDMSAVRYYLDRVGGPQFAPKQQGPAVVVNNATVSIDHGSVSAAMERQRKALDGEYEEVTPEA